jgi:hypothetical protein
MKPLSFDVWLAKRLGKQPSMLAHAVRSNHSFEVAAAAIGAICNDYAPFQREAPQYVRKKRIAKDEDTASALAIAVFAIEQDVYPCDPRNGFSRIAD